MTGDEGSLLSSACISAWAAFLCHSAVTKNPDPTCNPKLGDPSGLSIAFGLSVTLLSLCWTGWSYTAEDKLVYKTAGDNKDEEAAITNSSAPAASEVALNDEGKPKRIVTGVVTGGTDEYEAIQEGDGDNANSSAGTSVDPTQLSNSWRLNIALAAVSCWIAMTLTEWGEIQSMGNLANPTVGRVSMWVIVGSQWFVMSLYVWSLVAPRLFPNRDFS